MMALRSVSFAGPRRETGGRIMVRPTTPGTPFTSKTETSASPTPRSVITSSVSKAGFSRKELAAARIDFCSLGV